MPAPDAHTVIIARTFLRNSASHRIELIENEDRTWSVVDVMSSATTTVIARASVVRKVTRAAAFDAFRARCAALDAAGWARKFEITTAAPLT